MKEEVKKEEVSKSNNETTPTVTEEKSVTVDENKKVTNTTTTNQEKQTSKTETKSEEAKSEKNKKKNGKFKAIFIIILIAIIIGAIFAVVYHLFLAPKEIDLSKYLTIKYDGYNNYAIAEIEINEKDLNNYLKDSDTTKRFIKKVNLEINDNENLSNGKNLEIEASISDDWLKENKLRIKDKKIKLQVQGLEDSSIIDLSKYIEAEYSGYNKFATAKVSLSDSLKDEFEDSKLYDEFVKNVKL